MTLIHRMQLSSGLYVILGVFGGEAWLHTMNLNLMKVKADITGSVFNIESKFFILILTTGYF